MIKYAEKIIIGCLVIICIYLLYLNSNLTEKYHQQLSETEEYLQKKFSEINKIYDRFQAIIIKDNENNEILVNPKDSHVGESLIIKGTWEPHFRNFVNQFVKKGNVVLSMGANYGAHVVHFSNLVGKNGRVHAFEPHPEIFKFLYINRIWNDQRNVTLYKLAVTDKVKMVKFKKYDLLHNQGASKIVNNDNSLETLNILGVSIDSIKDIDKVDVIQMDIEGYSGLKNQDKIL